MIRAAIALVAAVALTGVTTGVAVAAPQPRDEESLCLPILMTCPAPTPSPSPSGGGGGGILDGVGDLLDGVADDALPDGDDPATWGPVVNDDDTVFTKPAAQLSGTSLSISGLKSLGLARIPMADGSHRVVIKMVADEVSMDGFMLDVKGHSGGTALVTNDANMTLTGHVEIYLDSLTATLPGGVGLSLLANTPPPEDELPPQLLRVTLGLVGVTADQIVHTDTHQELHPGT